MFSKSFYFTRSSLNITINIYHSLFAIIRAFVSKIKCVDNIVNILYVVQFIFVIKYLDLWRKRQKQ